jgi:hypothetical protein
MQACDNQQAKIVIDKQMLNGPSAYRLLSPEKLESHVLYVDFGV